MEISWKEVVEFHGHSCPGLASGVVMAKLGMEKIGVKRDGDEEILAITESDYCGVDALQVISGCTMGKGNLIFKNTGKKAFTFLNRKNGEGIRVYCDTSKLPDCSSREEKIKLILNTDPMSFCTIKDVKIDLPAPAEIFHSIVCDECLEVFAENRAILSKGKVYCRDCKMEYSREVV